MWANLKSHWMSKTPVSRSTLAIGLVVVALLSWYTYDPIYISGRWLGVDADRWLVAYVWTAILMGSVGTWWFVELNRYVYSLKWFLQYYQHPQLRLTPRIEPIVTGVLERGLFTTLSIVLLQGTGNSGDSNGAIAGGSAVLGAICAAYVGLKSIKRVQAQSIQIYSSLHSLWGSGVSIAFAVLGGWLFWQMSG